MSSSRMPTYFLSHGAGPWSFMEGEFRERFASLEASFAEVRREVDRNAAAAETLQAEVGRFLV